MAGPQLRHWDDLMDFVHILIDQMLKFLLHVPVLPKSANWNDFGNIGVLFYPFNCPLENWLLRAVPYFDAIFPAYS